MSTGGHLLVSPLTNNHLSKYFCLFQDTFFQLKPLNFLKLLKHKLFFQILQNAFVASSVTLNIKMLKCINSGVFHLSTADGSIRVIDETRKLDGY